MLEATTWPIPIPPAHAAPPAPAAAPVLRLRLRRATAPHRGVPALDGTPARLTVACEDAYALRVRRPTALRPAGRGRTAPHRARVGR